MDAGFVGTERDGVQRLDETSWMLIVYDESLDDDERPPAALLDRVAFMVDLTDVSTRLAALIPTQKNALPSAFFYVKSTHC